MLHVQHYPPGTSKWNKIEHRLFCHITQTWRGQPLLDRMAVVELIAATTTKAGLKVQSALDTASYEKGIKVSDAEMKTLDIQGDAFHPEWNYTKGYLWFAKRRNYQRENVFSQRLRNGTLAHCHVGMDVAQSTSWPSDRPGET